MTRRFVAVPAALALAGCANAPALQPVITLHSAFDVFATQQALKPGTATITGSAFMRQAGGGVVTCAGQEVRAVPATAYADERMQHLYSSVQRGSRPTGPSPNFVPNPPEYVQTTLLTRCDAQGNFEFARVQAGRYYVITTVIWRAGYNTEGGGLMLAVTAVEGQSQRVILSP